MQAQGVREVIVERKAGVSAAEQARLRAQAGVSYVGPGPLPNTEIDRAPAGRLAAVVAALARDPQVQYAEPNGEVHAASTPNDPYFGLQWALSNTGQSVLSTSGTPGDDIGATSAWSHSTGAGVTVAVVDTGVDPTAPDLTGQTVAGQSFSDGVQGAPTHGPERPRDLRERRHRGHPEQRRRRDRRGPGGEGDAVAGAGRERQRQHRQRGRRVQLRRPERRQDRKRQPRRRRDISDARAVHRGQPRHAVRGRSRQQRRTRARLRLEHAPFYPVRPPRGQPDLRRRHRPERSAGIVHELRRRQRRPVCTRGQHRLDLDGRPVRLRQRHLDGHTDGQRHARADAGEGPVAHRGPAQDRPPGRRQSGVSAGRAVGDRRRAQRGRCCGCRHPGGHARATARAFPVSGDRRAGPGAGHRDPTHAAVASGRGQPHPRRRPRRPWRPGPRVHPVGAGARADQLQRSCARRGWRPTVSCGSR